MVTTEKILIELENFSKLLSLTPPWSSDVWQWWRCVINEMELWSLYLLMDHNVFGRYNDEYLNLMTDLILRRIKELESVGQK